MRAASSHADRLDHAPAAADQDALLRLGLDQHARASTRNLPSLLLDVLDLDLDRVRNLLAGADQDLLAHQLGQQHRLGLVRALTPRSK